MDNDNRIISFDWAVKRMLRDKANFSVLEGLMTVLIGESMKIMEILESESNQDMPDDKFNRVDIKAKNSKGDIIIVEVQLTRELYFLERILFGVSKAVTEHISLGTRYEHVKKVYSINILYFDLGRGKDYLYHGTTQFKGVHTGDYLEVSTRDDGIVRMRTPESIFPEYYLIRVNQFNDVATTPIEEWMDYLKNERIRKDTTVPGLQEAREKLAYLHMTPQERAAYERHLDNLRIQNDVLNTARLEGWDEGLEKGMAEGMQKGMEKGMQKGMAEGMQKGMEKGMAEGMQKGMEKGMEKGMAEGMQKGMEKGMAEGMQKGMEKGMEKGKAEVVRNMKSLGMNVADIARFTGLTEEEIERLPVS